MIVPPDRPTCPQPGSPTPRIGSDIQAGNPFNSFGGERRPVGIHQVIELAPDMGHAGCFLDRAVFVELVEAGVRVGL